MEKWKLGVIGLLILGLVGYGVSQQQADKSGDIIASLSDKSGSQPDENKAAIFIGQQLGGDKIPAWTKIGPWANSKQSITLDSLKGKPALVEFFSIDCPHCQEAAPIMEALYKRYQPRGLKMVAIQSPIRPQDPTRNETHWPEVQKFIKAAGLTYPVGMDKGGAYFQKTLKGVTYPTTMLAKPSGQVVHAQTGYDVEEATELAVELEKQLPGKGTAKERAADLAKFLRPFLFGNRKVDAALFKSLTDDLEQRLMGKV